MTTKKTKEFSCKDQINLKMASIFMAMPHPLNPLGTSQILMEALRIPLVNLNLLLPLVLLSLLSSSPLFLPNYIPIFSSPFMDLALYSITMHPTDPLSPNLFLLWRPNDEMVSKTGLFFLVASFIVASLVKIATMHAIAMLYTRQLPTLGDVLSATKKKVKGPLVTQSCIAALYLASTILLAALVRGIAMLMWSHHSSMFTIPFIFLAVWGVPQYLHLTTIWLLSMVVSVEEEGCSGLAAITRAQDLINGKRKQGILITVVAVVLMTAVTMVYGFAMSWSAYSTVARLVMGLIYVGIVLVLNLFTLAANTVFYHECQRGNGQGEGARRMNGDLACASLLVDAQASEELPNIISMQ